MSVEEREELNARVAREVLGWRQVGRQWAGTRYAAERQGRGFLRPYFDPARRVEHAWAIREHLRREGVHCCVWDCFPYTAAYETVLVGLGHRLGPEPSPQEEDGSVYAYGEPGDFNPAPAICRAALLLREQQRGREGGGV